jgi:SNF2 family DNA or RNA helicase
VHGHAQLTGPTHTAELRKRIEPFYIRRTADDIGADLPELTRHTQPVELKVSERRAVDDLIDRAGGHAAVLQAVLSGAMSNRVLEAITGLRKLASAAKRMSTVELVNNALDQDQSVVVFTWMKETAASILNYFKEMQAEMFPRGYLVTGDFDQDFREYEVEQFQQNGGVLCATYGALKEGVTLTKARHVILHDMMFVPSDMLQAEKRIHRIGQHQACTSTWMIADGTIDQMLMETVYSKLRDHGAVFDEQHDALAELEQFNPEQGYIERMTEALEAWRRSQ